METLLSKRKFKQVEELRFFMQAGNLERMSPIIAPLIASVIDVKKKKNPNPEKKNAIFLAGFWIVYILLIWNADLVMMPVEDGYKYILTVLDGYTRYAWAIPLKHKDGLTVSNAFKDIMLKSKSRPNKLWVDQGKEFYNEHMYKLFRFKKEDVLKKDEDGEYKNQIYSIFNFGKNPVIERFNRTLTNKLWKQFTVNGNQKWLHILHPTVSKYKNTIHSTIGTTPALASKDPSLVKIQAEAPPDSKLKFKVGDRFVFSNGKTDSKRVIAGTGRRRSLKSQK